MDKSSYLYMMGSASRRALYTGVCASLYERVWEHKNNLGGYFTSKYKCYRLVYFEQYGNVEFAIAREKEAKGWRREKKDRLVETLNPEWKDLAADWYPDGLRLDGEPFPKKKERKVPHPYSAARGHPSKPKSGLPGTPVGSAASLTGFGMTIVCISNRKTARSLAPIRRLETPASQNRI